MPTYSLTLTESQAFEVNDAIAEVIHRMLTVGQTATEVQEHSLAQLWAVKQAIACAAFGDDSPGIEHKRADVERAIAAPKAHPREHAYL